MVRIRLAFLLLTFLSFAAPLWASDVTVEEGEEEIVITLHVELCPDPKDNPDTEQTEGPTVEQVQQFVEAHQANVTQIWNACPKRFRTSRDSPPKRVRFVFDISVIEDCDQERDPNKKRIKVHLGKAPPESGKRADTENLWLEGTPSKTVAHEFGHVMGLGEEYQYGNGPTRENLMGRGNFEKIEPYQIATILFVHLGNPDDAEIRRRELMRTLLRMRDQKTAKEIAAQNGINGEQYDAYKDFFSSNNTQIQPGPPEGASSR